MSVLGNIATIVLNGIQTGAIYILMAIGLSIILGTLRFVNFAHGALYLIGTYVGLFITLEVTLTNGLLQEWGYADQGLGLGYLAALILVPLVLFVFGVLMERFIARPFYDRSDLDQILVTFGIALIVQEVFRVFFGGQSINFARPEWASGPITLPLVGGFSRWRLAVILITAVLVFLVFLLVEYTDFGLIVRAGTHDPEMVRLLGIKISRPYAVMFGLGAALAGIAGVVGAPLEAVNPGIGMRTLVPAFLTVVIGGIGSIRGAVVGGTLIGLIYSTLIGMPDLTIPVVDVTLKFAPWAQVGIYAFAALVLLTRPQGLFGEEEIGA